MHVGSGHLCGSTLDLYEAHPDHDAVAIVFEANVVGAVSMVGSLTLRNLVVLDGNVCGLLESKIVLRRGLHSV